jgi:hypothetical protein
VFEFIKRTSNNLLPVCHIIKCHPSAVNYQPTGLFHILIKCQCGFLFSDTFWVAEEYINSYIHYCKKPQHYLRTVLSWEWWIFWCNWKNCLCGVLVSVCDRQRLGVSGSVSVRAKCLVSHIHSECTRWATHFGHTPAAMLKDMWRHYSQVDPKPLPYSLADSLWCIFTPLTPQAHKNLITAHCSSLVQVISATGMLTTLAVQDNQTINTPLQQKNSVLLVLCTFNSGTNCKKKRQKDYSVHIQSVPGGMCQTLGGCSLC